MREEHRYGLSILSDFYITDNSEVNGLYFGFAVEGERLVPEERGDEILHRHQQDGHQKGRGIISKTGINKVV